MNRQTIYAIHRKAVIQIAVLAFVLGTVITAGLAFFLIAATATGTPRADVRYIALVIPGTHLLAWSVITGFLFSLYMRAVHLDPPLKSSKNGTTPPHPTGKRPQNDPDIREIHGYYSGKTGKWTFDD